MPHSRKRFVVELFLKKLAFSRVVTIQGCRQSGKSFLAKQLLPLLIPNSAYLTFDQKRLKTFAEVNPESFLNKYKDSSPLIIDEAQKVPDIFDAVKFEVDQNPRPGQYVLLGSTEFSKLLQIRESLTGRMSRIRLYPLTLAECLELKPDFSKNQGHLLNSKPRATRTQFLKHLDQGGFPGIFAVRNHTSRDEFFQDWIDLTLQRDLHQFPRIAVDSELASEILQRIPILSEPSATNIARAIKKDTRVVQKVLGLLETLFVIHRLLPFREGGGKPLYFLCDVGLATHLGADFERQLWTWLLQEQLAQRNFQTDEGWKMYYFRSPKGKFIHLVVENIKKKEIHAMKLLSSEKTDLREFEILKAFEKRVREQFLRPQLMVLGPGPYEKLESSIVGYPWESIV